MNQKLKSQSGFSLVESVVSMGLLMGLSAVAYTIYKNTHLASKTLSENDSYRTTAEAGLNTLKKVLSPTDTFDQGICRMMESRASSQGIGRIEFKFPKENSGTDLLASEWQKVFGTTEWKVSEKCSSDTYTKCLTPLPGNTVIDSKLAHKIYFKFRLRPIYTRTSDSGAFRPIDISSDVAANARDVSFYLTSSVYDMNGTSPLFSLSTVVWPGQYKCLKNGLTLLLSSIGSSYEGSTPLFADATEEGDKAKGKTERNYGKIIDIDYIPEIRLGSKLVNNTIRSTDEFSTFSCSQRRFRCGENDNFDDSIMARGNIKMLTNNGLTAGNTLKVSMEAYFTEGEDKPLVNPGAFRTSFRAAEPAFDQDGKPQMVINNEQNTFGIQFTNVGSQCKQLCKEGLEDPDKKYKVLLRFILKDYGNHQTDVYDERDLSCTCCFTKQCARFGLNNYGECTKKPSEPLDSRIPECAITKGTVSEVTRDPASPPTGCLYASKDRGNLVFKTALCTTKKKILCYASGKFVLAKEKAKDVIVTDYKDARKSCYELSYQKMNKDGFDNFLKQMNTYSSSVMKYFPTSGDDYEFHNAATAGIFIAPFTQKQADEVRDLLSNKDEVWVGYQALSENTLMAEPPVIDYTTYDYLTYNLGAIHYVAKDSPPDVGTGEKGIFHHSRRNLGVFWGQEKSYRPLCIAADGNVTISSRTATSFNQAHEHCLDDNMAFVAPIKTSQWMQASYLLNPPDEFMPWGIEASGAPRSASAYVALVKVGTDGWRNSAFYSGTNYRETFLKNGLQAPKQPALVKDSNAQVNAKVCKEGTNYKIRQASESCSAVAYVENYPEKVVCKDFSLQNAFSYTCDLFTGTLNENDKYNFMLKLLSTSMTKTERMAFRAIEVDLLTGFDETLYQQQIETYSQGH